MQQLDRSRIDIKVQLKTQPQQDVGSMLIGGYPRIAQCPEQDGVELIPKHFHRSRRQADAFAQIFVCAPVEFHKLERPICRCARRPQHFHRFRRNFLADAITRDDRDTRCRTAVAQGCLRHEKFLRGLSYHRAVPATAHAACHVAAACRGGRLFGPIRRFSTKCPADFKPTLPSAQKISQYDPTSAQSQYPAR